jgi:hypothetical protein
MKPLQRIRIAGALLLAALSAGCAGEAGEQMFNRPGRFDYFACPEIATTMQGAVRREQELKTLIDRAEKESIGVLIAGPSYRGDLLRAQGEQKMLAEVAARKNCAAEPPAPAAKPARPASPPRR